MDFGARQADVTTTNNTNSSGASVPMAEGPHAMGGLTMGQDLASNPDTLMTADSVIPSATINLSETQQNAIDAVDEEADTNDASVGDDTLVDDDDDDLDESPSAPKKRKMTTDEASTAAAAATEEIEETVDATTGPVTAEDTEMGGIGTDAVEGTVTTEDIEAVDHVVAIGSAIVAGQEAATGAAVAAALIARDADIRRLVMAQQQAEQQQREVESRDALEQQAALARLLETREVLEVEEAAPRVFRPFTIFEDTEDAETLNRLNHAANNLVVETAAAQRQREAELAEPGQENKPWYPEAVVEQIIVERAIEPRGDPNVFVDPLLSRTPANLATDGSYADQVPQILHSETTGRRALGMLHTEPFLEAEDDAVEEERSQRTEAHRVNAAQAIAVVEAAAVDNINRLREARYYNPARRAPRPPVHIDPREPVVASPRPVAALQRAPNAPTPAAAVLEPVDGLQGGFTPPAPAGGLRALQFGGTVPDADIAGLRADTAMPTVAARIIPEVLPFVGLNRSRAPPPARLRLPGAPLSMADAIRTAPWTPADPVSRTPAHLTSVRITGRVMMSAAEFLAEDEEVDETEAETDVEDLEM